jgi:hypothetical protein
MQPEPEDAQTSSTLRGWIVKVHRHVAKALADAIERLRWDVVEKAGSRASQMHGPRSLELAHASRGESCHVRPCVGGTCRLCYKPSRLEIVNQPGRSARRKAGGAGQIAHSEFSIRGLGKHHEGGVLAGSHTSTSNQIGVQKPRYDLDDPHEDPPQLLLRR